MDETMMYENVWVDEVSAYDSFSFNVPNPEKIDRDAWSTQLVPEFAKLGLVCTWWNEHEMGCTIDPKIDIPRPDVFLRAQDALYAFISGFSAKLALKVLSGDEWLITRDFEDEISLDPVRERFETFISKYEKFMKDVGQRFPCELKPNVPNEHSIAFVANARIFEILAVLVWQVVVHGNLDVEQELHSLLEFYERPSGFEHNPCTDSGPGYDDMMEPSKSLNDQIGELQIC
ncbi:hypothetical protein RchiOBHm_Chr6g0271691 [Rosa chinensis]|uniref:Uncharacterized protein n=1 Tax=Rosa chinensis TaxID=74649 RepID=A0A2P6PR01_ROSCH|nr:uncharacterized protein LOC112173479 isoform X2 [Rosa chinensis]PRQ24369.1 hypothetical protein RchiOBHm_Chr6g0271691 [Rosa chinensis]